MQSDFLRIRLHISLRKATTNFLYVKSFRDNVIRHSLAYLTVYKWLMGYVICYLKFWDKVAKTAILNNGLSL